MSMPNYLIISGPNITGVHQEVNRMINEGYLPAGGVTVYTGIGVIQAMIRTTITVPVKADVSPGARNQPVDPPKPETKKKVSKKKAASKAWTKKKPKK